jgi:phage terminase large subunit
MEITCKNGYQAVFRGLDDIEKVKSSTPLKGVFTDIWIEEATELTEDIIGTLRKRLRGKTGTDQRKTITLTFNPIYKTHWIYKKYFLHNWIEGENLYQSDDLLILKTTYKDNRFLTHDDIYELENEKDEYLYNVYTLGNWGVLGDLIFTNWETRDLTEIIPHFDYIRNGLDFGFDPHPTAYNRTHYDRKRHVLYIFKEFNELGLTNAMIAERLKPIIGSEPIVCDSAEPKSIQELINYGINAIEAIKGPDSIRFGIRWLKGLNRIVIHTGCQNTINEFGLYQYKKNKDGETLPQPVDKFNHHIDNIRYQYEDEALNSGDDFGIVELGEYAY